MAIAFGSRAGSLPCAWHGLDERFAAPMPGSEDRLCRRTLRE